MIKCKRCGFENKEESKFCGNCGMPLQSKHAGKRIIIGGICGVLAVISITIAALFLAGKNQANSEQAEKTSEEDVQKKVMEKKGEEEKPVADEVKKSTEPPIFSKRIWDYDGTIYTSYAVEHTDWISLTGDYHDTFLAYQDNIYLRKENNVENTTRELVRQNLNGKETVIAEDVNPLYGLVIYEDYLYYIALDSSMQSEGKRVDLSDLSITDSEDYQIKAADMDTWILCGIKGEESGQLFLCDPGFENIERLDITADAFMGIYDGKVYFQTQENEQYNIQSYDVKTGDTGSVLEGQKEPAALSGSDLFYGEKTKSKTILHRMDLGGDGEIYDYDLKDIDVYMKGSFYEANNKVYLTRFQQEKEDANTELIELDLESGSYESIGTWKNTEIQSAENARYQAYAEKIKEEEEKYGAVKVQNQDSYACMTGVCFVDLVDFADNGKEQLVIAHQNIERECSYEIWSWEEGQMVLMETGDLFNSDGGVHEVMYSHSKGKTYLVTGEMSDLVDYAYHGYSGDGFGWVFEMSMDMLADEDEKYYVNGQVVSEDVYDEAYDSWFVDVTSYNLSYECDKVLELMDEVKAKLNS